LAWTGDRYRFETYRIEFNYPGQMAEKKSAWFSYLIMAMVLNVISITPGCNIEGNHPGFSKTGSGIYYRLNSIGEGLTNPKPGDIITVDLQYITPCDSLFFTGRRLFMLEEPPIPGSVEECFAMLRTGDQADFILDANTFFTLTLGTSLPGFLKEGDYIMISVKMLDIHTRQSYYEKKEADKAWLDDLGKYEKRVLENYILNNKLDIVPDEHGLYFMQIRSGTGKRVTAGDTVELHYEGRFINGKFFDSTYERGETFRFVYGQEMQLIKGLEKAVGRMHEGEKALVLLPSELAFGKSGSSTGLVPPYTSIIYEIKVTRVH